MPARNRFLQSLPTDLTELGTGNHFISLKEMGEQDKNEFITRLFEAFSKDQQLSQALVVFLDEAHFFSDGKPASAIQNAVRQTRKFGVHVVLSTQSPMDFNYSYKHIRENTTGNFFLQREYLDYAENYLGDPEMSSYIGDLSSLRMHGYVEDSGSGGWRWVFPGVAEYSRK